jgi:hypothetical protein|tara:strand:+ start:366 stop:569 length:204 start_codon:yes stop_codon:yes gene_type:complete
MGILDKIKNTQSQESNNSLLSSRANLDQKEITIILNMIKESKFQGKDLEAVYNLVVKLQTQYTALSK